MRYILSLVMFVALLSGSAIAQNPTAPVKEMNPNSWKDFTSKKGQFTVSLPGRPEHQDLSHKTEVGPIESHCFVLDTDFASYFIAYTELPPGSNPTTEENKAKLDENRNQPATDGSRLISETEVSIGGTMGKESLVEKKDLISRSRYVYIKDRLYQLIITAPRTVVFHNGKTSANPVDRSELFEKVSATFFDSFKLK